MYNYEKYNERFVQDFQIENNIIKESIMNCIIHPNSSEYITLKTFFHTSRNEYSSLKMIDDM